MFDDAADECVLKAIPQQEAIRARLSKLARERALLRDLLKLSARREDLCRADANNTDKVEA